MATPSTQTGATPQIEPELKLSNDQAILFIAASETDSNLFYASQFHAGDPIAYIEFRGARILLLNELELGRGKKEGRADEVVSLLPYEEKLRKNGEPPPKITDTLELFLAERGIRKLLVPATFPIAHADRLRSKSFEIDFREEPFYPERAVKTAAEIDRIAASQNITVAAMDLAIEIIRKSRVSGDILELDGEPLTAEAVRREIHRFLFDEGYHAEQTIVAGGDQACDPHVRGSGPLPANRPIVIDIFPRSTQTRYWGDMTRTVLRGKPDPEVERLFQDVFDAHELACSLLKDGVDGLDVHNAVMDFFKSRSRETEERDGKMVGYIHSTGHGIGLDIHEYPKIGRAKNTLRAGHVVTIEPGLYYSGLGGVRLEDLVVVTETGHRNLTAYPKELVV